MTTIRLAQDADLPLLAGIEDAGDALFVERFGEVAWPAASSGEERVGEPGALLEATHAELVARGAREVTLRTYADVPWNAPFCARHGYVELDPLPAWLEPMRQTELRMGMERHGRRIAMVRDLSPG